MSAHNFTVERRERGQYVDFVVMCDGRYEVAETSSPDIVRAILSHVDLYAALENLLDDPACVECQTAARAALAKARGEG